MGKAIKPERPSEIPQPDQQPEIKPDIPEEPAAPEQAPQIPPDEKPGDPSSPIPTA